MSDTITEIKNKPFSLRTDTEKAIVWLWEYADGYESAAADAAIDYGITQARIATLEAQNKKLVEALEKACKLEHFKEHTYGGFEFSKCPHHSCVAARALLSEVAQ